MCGRKSLGGDKTFSEFTCCYVYKGRYIYDRVCNLEQPNLIIFFSSTLCRWMALTVKYTLRENAVDHFPTDAEYRYTGSRSLEI